MDNKETELLGQLTSLSVNRKILRLAEPGVAVKI